MLVCLSLVSEMIMDCFNPLLDFLGYWACLKKQKDLASLAGMCRLVSFTQEWQKILTKTIPTGKHRLKYNYHDQTKFLLQ